MRLLRIINSVMVGFAVIVGVFLASNGSMTRIDILSLLSGFTVGFTISASSMVLNDIVDIEIDRINAPERPLPSNTLSLRTAWVCYFILLLAGFLAASYTGLDSLLTAIAGGVIAALYNLKLKLSGFPGNVAVAFSTSLPFLYAVTIVKDANVIVLVFWAMVFLTVLGREIAKDIADVEGDAVKGARTIPIVYGRRTASLIAALFYVTAVSLSPLPLALDLVRNTRVYAIGVAVVDILLIYSLAILVRNPRKNTALYHKRVVLVAMMIGLIIFLLSVV
jgi:geranylgeranylglycerol-phosphate geranylgeranyltransferase